MYSERVFAITPVHTGHQKTLCVFSVRDGGKKPQSFHSSVQKVYLNSLDSLDLCNSGLRPHINFRYALLSVVLCCHLVLFQRTGLLLHLSLPNKPMLNHLFKSYLVMLLASLSFQISAPLVPSCVGCLGRVTPACRSSSVKE